MRSKAIPFFIVWGRSARLLKPVFTIRSAGVVMAHISSWLTTPLLLADLALKMNEEQGVLPPYGMLIVDEAHHFPALAAEHLATSVSFSECLGLVKRLLCAGRQVLRRAQGVIRLDANSGRGRGGNGFQVRRRGVF